MVSLKERKAALKRKRPGGKAAKRAPAPAADYDEDDAMIAALERKLGGTKKKSARKALDAEFAEDGFGDGFMDFLDKVDRVGGAEAPEDDGDGGDDDGDSAADDDARGDAGGDDAADDGRGGTTVHYAPTRGEDLYGRSTTGGAWVPPSLRRRLEAKGFSGGGGAPSSASAALMGCLNRVADATVGACAAEIVAAYANHPAAAVNAAVVDQCAAQCLHAKQSMAATLIPPYAACVAAVHVGGGRDLGSAVLEELRRALAPYAENGAAPGAAAPPRVANAAALLAALCDCGLVGAALPLSLAEALAGRGAAADLELAALLAAGCRDRARRDAPERLRALPEKRSAGADDARSRHAAAALAAACAATVSKSDRLAREADVARSKKLRAAVAAAARAAGARLAPLALEWADLRDADAKGRWWKQGAAWDARRATAGAGAPPPSRATVPAAGALEGLARRHRMNTAPRQAAFAALVGAADADDAAWRLGDLAAAKACDDATAAAVLVHCCGAEARANGFYGAVAAARRGQAKDFGFGLKLAFWDALRAPRRTGEALEAAARRATNLGKLLGGLLGPDLAVGAALGRVDADALRAPACCFLVVAALRGLLEAADDATFAAALRAPGDAPSLDALYAFANAKLRPSPATAGDPAKARAWDARRRRLAAFLLDPAAPAAEKTKKKKKKKELS